VASASKHGEPTESGIAPPLGAGLADRVVQRHIYFALTRHVRVNRETAPANRAALKLDLARLGQTTPEIDHHVRSSPGQRQRNHVTDLAVDAGDERDLPLR
jgi:hypothetical protein